MNNIPLNFSQARILVIGDIMLDEYWFGETQRISPEAPVPVVKINTDKYRLGGAANVAANIASLGATVHLIGAVGNDNHCKTLQSLLKQKKVQYHFLTLEQQKTTRKLRIISQNQQLIRLDFEQPSHLIDQQELIKVYQQILSQVDVIIFSDYAKGVLNNSKLLIQQAKKANKTILVDPKQHFSNYQGATIITPNLKEFETYVGKCDNLNQLTNKAQHLCQQYQLNAILITRGSEGMSLITKSGDSEHIPTQAQQVYDVTGAGDTVIAVLAASLSIQQPLTRAIRIANSAAAIVVSKIGTASITSLELQQILNSTGIGNHDLVTESKLLTAITAAKQHGEKIVMTNGCFDILHSGHVHYLQQAKSLGNRLIIAINTDESVRKLKGKQRPINTLKQRITVLSSLKCVDWVIPFNEDTPKNLISKLQPDILVKGADYQIKDIAGADIVQQYGGKVTTIPLQPGVSTSAIIDKICS